MRISIFFHASVIIIFFRGDRSFPRNIDVNTTELMNENRTRSKIFVDNIFETSLTDLIVVNMSPPIIIITQLPDTLMGFMCRPKSNCYDYD